MSFKNSLPNKFDVVRKRNILLEVVSTFKLRPFSIKVVTFLDETFQVGEVQQYMLVKDIKDKIEKTTGIPG